MNLKELLESKQCIKLVCGAGNEDVESIERLVHIYTLAGIRYFDISANIQVLRAVRNKLKELGVEGFINVSYGIAGDPHIKKLFISDKCIGCGACNRQCPTNAIYFSPNHNKMKVIAERCIGCEKCIPFCRFEAMHMISKPIPIKDTLSELVKEGIDSVELHANGTQDEIFYKLSEIESHFDGLISICMDRSIYGDKALINIFREIIEHRGPFSTIIQADGLPMGGSDDTLGTTLQAVAIGQMINRAYLPAYLLLSGGTNSQTGELAHQCNVDYHGISLGSYARKIVKDEKDLDRAILIAKYLVDEVLSRGIEW